MIKFSIKNTENYALVTFELEGIIVPKQLQSLSPPEAVVNNFAHKGVILSGKGPIWLFGFLVHFYHATAWVATYDPRLQGAVVVESHTPNVQAGDIIPLQKPTDASI